MNFGTQSIDRMTITASGDVGIGMVPDTRFMVWNGSTAGRYTTGGWTHSSDARLKSDVQPISDSLQKVLSLNQVHYHFTSDPSQKTQIGFIAQEVEPIFPEVVETAKDGFKSMIYANLIAPVVGAIQELFADVQSLRAELKLVKDENLNLKKENAAIKAYLCAKDPDADLCQ